MTKTQSKNYLIYMAAVVAIGFFFSCTEDIFQTMLAAAAGGGFFAALCAAKAKAYTVIPPVVLTPAITYLATGSINAAVLSLSFLPVGIAVYYSICKKLSRTQTISRVIVALALFYGVVHVGYIIALFGVFTPETVGKFVQLNLDLFKSYFEQLKQLYIENGIEAEELFSDEVLQFVTESMRILWFGVFLAFCGVLGFFSTHLAKHLCKKEGVFPAECGDWKVVFSKTGALVFIFAYIAGNIYSAEKEGLYLAFAINAICMCLYPAVIYMGASKILQRMHSRRRVSFVITAIIAFLLFGQYIMPFLIIVGIYATLTQGKKTV